MSKKAPLKAAPTGDSLTPEEQKFFDTAGEEGGTTAAAPVEEAAPVTQPDPAPEPEQEEGVAPENTAPEAGQQAAQKQKMVPHQALHEAREQVKEYKEQMRLRDQQYKTLEERTNLLLQNLTKQPTQTDAAQPQQQAFPDPENDPLGYILASVKTLDERTKQFEASQKQQAEQGQQYNALSQLQNEAMTREQEFRAETPDYDAASQYLQQARVKELAALGYSGTEAREAMKQEAIGIAQRMIQQGKNPAQAIYEMAKLRGYQPAPDPTATPEPTPEQTAVEQATGKLTTVQKGQRQTATLSQTRGSAPSPMTAQRLMEMSPAEFESFRAKSPNEFRNLMGA